MRPVSALVEKQWRMPVNGLDHDPLPATRLDAFLRRHGIHSVALERASGLARQHLARLRAGKMDPNRRTIVAITRGCRKLMNDPSVTALDLFDLD